VKRGEVVDSKNGVITWFKAGSIDSIQGYVIQKALRNPEAPEATVFSLSA